MRYANIVYTEEILPEELPKAIDISRVLETYARHSCHLGAWTAGKPEPTELPEVKDTTHHVRDVKLNDTGGLHVSYSFISTPKGFKLMKEYDESNFKMTPVVSDDGRMIVRFDFQKEE